MTAKPLLAIFLLMPGLALAGEPHALLFHVADERLALT